MSNNELEKLFYESCQVVKKAGEFLTEEFGRVSAAQIETKSLNSLVSYADKKAEEILTKGLLKCLPGSTFLTEEKTISQERGEFQWIIDPLDGTTNFLHQIPIYAVSVGLRQGDEMILGIVYEPNRKECFYAWKGGGAFLNGEKIEVKKNDKLANSLLATGFPYYEFEKTPQYLEALKELMQSTRGLRRMGAAAVDLAYTAAGRFDVFYEYNLEIWDVAAGYFIVQEAGGRVCDFSGGNKYVDGTEIIAGSPKITKEVLKILQKSFV